MLGKLRKLSTAVLGFSAVWLFAAQVASAQPGFAEVPGSPFATGTSPQSIAFSPNGALVATANAGANNVSVFTVSSSGALSALSGSPFTTGAGPQSLAFSPSGGLLAVANKGDNTVSMFSVSSSGSLTQVLGSPFKTGAAPDSVAFSASGGLLAVANGVDNTVSVFTVSSSGSLTQVGSPAAVGTTPDSVAFTPSGGLYNNLPANTSLLAVANAGSSNVSIFSVPSTGSLTRIGAYPTGTTPTSVAFRPPGSSQIAGYIGNLVTANSGSNNVTVFRVSSAGTLDAPAAFTAGHGPRSVQYSATSAASGGLLATANTTDNDLSVFSAPSVSGNLFPLSLTGFPLRLGSAASGPASVAFSPNSELLATANAASNNISVFEIVDCSATFNQAFQAGWGAGYNPGFNTVFRAAYKSGGPWQVGFTRGWAAAHALHSVTGAHTVSHAARITTTGSPATDPTTPAQAACNPVFNPAFNQGFNAAFNAAYNAAYDAAFNNGFRKGYAVGLQS